MMLHITMLTGEDISEVAVLGDCGGDFSEIEYVINKTKLYVVLKGVAWTHLN